MNFRTLYDKILFTFDDAHGSTGFNNVSTGGIVFSSFHHDASSPRWGTAIKIGDDVKDVAVGDKILIEPLKWTEAHKIDGVEFWMTTEEQVMCVDKKE